MYKCIPALCVLPNLGILVWCGSDVFISISQQLSGFSVSSTHIYNAVNWLSDYKYQVSEAVILEFTQYYCYIFTEKGGLKRLCVVHSIITRESSTKDEWIESWFYYHLPTQSGNVQNNVPFMNEPLLISSTCKTSRDCIKFPWSFAKFSILSNECTMI